MSPDKSLAEQIGEIAIHGYLKDAKVSEDGATIELYVTRKFDAATSVDYDVAKTYLIQITPGPCTHIYHIRRFHDHWPSDRRVGEVQVSGVVRHTQESNGFAKCEKRALDFSVVLVNSSDEVIETITGVNQEGGIDLTHFTVTVTEVPPSDPIIDTERYAGLSRSDLIARLAEHENAYVNRLGDD